MTDHHDPLDELASAHLDGASDPATPPDAEVLRRADQQAAARSALRDLKPRRDDERREQAIAAALAAFDAEPVGGHAVVTPLRRRRISTRAVGLAGMAAAIALLALVVPLLGRLDSGVRDEVVSPSVESSQDATSDQSSFATGDAPAELRSSDASSQDLGAFATTDELTDAVRTQLGSTAGAATGGGNGGGGTTASGSAVPGCDAQRAEGGTEVLAATATLEGRPVIVVVHEDPAGNRTLLALSGQDCTTVATIRL